MVFQTKCKKCNEFSKNRKSHCNYNCSLKGKIKISLTKITMIEIKNVLENNIGCYINIDTITKYKREIKQLKKE